MAIEDLSGLAAVVVEMLDLYFSLITMDLTSYDVCDVILELFKRHQAVIAWQGKPHDRVTLIKAEAVLAPYNGIMSYLLSQEFLIALPVRCQQWYNQQREEILSSPRLR